MMRIVSLHGHPEDPLEFDRYYRDVHTPLVQRIPGVRRIRFGRVLRTSDDSPPPYYLVSDVYFDDAAALEAAEQTSEMAAALADVPNFASGGVTIVVCECEDYLPVTDAPPTASAEHRAVSSSPQGG
jgi:uncharacterized protein (TIGR02118 family)